MPNSTHRHRIRLSSGKRRGAPLLIWITAAGIGLAAVLLGLCSAWSFRLFESLCERWWWWPFLALPAGGLAITWAMRRVGPGTEGSGIQQAVAALRVADSPERAGVLLSLRLAAAKFLAIIAGLGSGFVLGLEGPTVQVGASMLYAARRFEPRDNAVTRRQLILAGGSAGIAAAFNAPLAGLMFAFEELAHSMEWRASGKLVLAVVFAGATTYCLRGDHVFFGSIASGPQPLFLLALIAVMAVCGGLIGGAFSWLAIRSYKWLPKPILRLQQRRPYVFVLLCALTVAVAGLGAPIFGSGSELTFELLHSQKQVSWLYAPLKFVGFLATSLSGLPGGIFTPSLSVGAGMGTWFAALADPAWRPEILAVGMTAVLAGVTRAPLTSAFIMIEMTAGRTISLELLLAAMLAAHVARLFHVRFYHQLADRVLRALERREPGSAEKNDQIEAV